VTEDPDVLNQVYLRLWLKTLVS